MKVTAEHLKAFISPLLQSQAPELYIESQVAVEISQRKIVAWLIKSRKHGQRLLRPNANGPAAKCGSSTIRAKVDLVPTVFSIQGEATHEYLIILVLLSEWQSASYFARHCSISSDNEHSKNRRLITSSAIYNSKVSGYTEVETNTDTSSLRYLRFATFRSYIRPR